MSLLTLLKGGIQNQGFSPLSLSPLLWLDASDESTITESSGSVSQWDDKSGNVNNFTQETEGAQPTTQDDVLNSLNVISFDGSDVLESSLILPSTITQFIVYNSRVSGTLISSTVDNQQIQRDTTIWFSSSSASITISENLNDNNIFTTDYNFDTDNYAIYLDGDPVGSSISAGDGSAGSLVIGARRGDLEFYIGDIAEILIFGSVLSDSEKNLIGQYLAEKWHVSWSDIS